MTKPQRLKGKYSADEKLTLLDPIVNWEPIDPAEQTLCRYLVVWGEVIEPFLNLRNHGRQLRTFLSPQLSPFTLYEFEFLPQLRSQCLIPRIFLNDPLPARCGNVIFIVFV